MFDNYDDFALPSKDNIELMTREYAKLNNNYDSENVSEDYKFLQNVYECIYNAFNMIGTIVELNPKNKKFYNLGEKIGKLKNEYESDFVKYELKLPTSKYTFAENTIVYDLIKIFVKACKDCILNFNNYNYSKKYTLKFCEIIECIVKY